MSREKLTCSTADYWAHFRTLVEVELRADGSKVHSILRPNKQQHFALNER